MASREASRPRGADVGSVVISLDAELAWGFHDLQEPPATRIERARGSWLDLLGLFEEFEIPATWAIVGHLFLEECDGRHEDLTTPEGWFSSDPGGRTDEGNVWFAPDLVRAVRDADVDHEIASHTFSHVEFGSEATTKPMAVSELRESTRLANVWDLELRSLVFPRNAVGHREVLSEFGFRSYRGVAPDRWYDGTGGEPIGKALSMTLGRTPPPLVTPTVDRFGLVNIPASLFLFSFEGLPKRVATAFGGDPVVRAAKRGIDAAAASEETFHLWLHPNNLTAPEDLERIRSVLEHLTTVESNTGLDVETMDRIATETLSARE